MDVVVQQACDRIAQGVVNYSTNGDKFRKVCYKVPHAYLTCGSKLETLILASKKFRN